MYLLMFPCVFISSNVEGEGDKETGRRKASSISSSETGDDGLSTEFCVFACIFTDF
jgi:hypothetical protein